MGRQIIQPCRILQDKQVMYAYEHAFDNDEVQEWLDSQIRHMIMMDLPGCGQLY